MSESPKQSSTLPRIVGACVATVAAAFAMKYFGVGLDLISGEVNGGFLVFVLAAILFGVTVYLGLRTRQDD